MRKHLSSKAPCSSTTSQNGTGRWKKYLYLNVLQVLEPITTKKICTSETRSESALGFIDCRGNPVTKLERVLCMQSFANHVTQTGVIRESHWFAFCQLFIFLRLKLTWWGGVLFNISRWQRVYNTITGQQNTFWLPLFPVVAKPEFSNSAYALSFSRNLLFITFSILILILFKILISLSL